jgi:hypothetical protein
MTQLPGTVPTALYPVIVLPLMSQITTVPVESSRQKMLPLRSVAAICQLPGTAPRLTPCTIEKPLISQIATVGQWHCTIAARY